MTKTQENLAVAFAGESRANRKYLAFAKVAESESRPNLARLLRAVAEGETVHALKHLNVSGEVRSSVENIKSAIAGELYEFEKMYPQFIAEAEAEENKAAEISFIGANAVEKIHHQNFSAALETIEDGGDILTEIYHVCQICGNLFSGSVPDICPICQTPKDKFTLVP
jgi:rubrerythrin